jgi:L-aminopeptidase/D-esterase-like protein
MSVVTEHIQVPGFKLGHATLGSGESGCTVLLADKLAPAAVEVRGGAPGTRETDLLGAGKSVQSLDALLLTGGSAFGLAAADGVVEWLRQQGRGFQTSVINVPIVAAAVIFDLTGPEPIWPTSDHGLMAADQADMMFFGGRIGAGAGARVSKVLGRDHSIRAGIGVAQIETRAGLVSAVFVNNAFGDVYDDQTASPLTLPGGGPASTEDILIFGTDEEDRGQNTVIGAIAVSRALDHDALTRIAVAGHAGIARVIRPASCPVDGDSVFAIASENGRCTGTDLMQLTAGTQIVVARALISAVQ